MNLICTDNELARDVGIRAFKKATPTKTRRVLDRGWLIHLALRVVEATKGKEYMRQCVKNWKGGGFDGSSSRRRGPDCLLRLMAKTDGWSWLRHRWGNDYGIPMPPCRPPKGGTGVNHSPATPSA
jgi:hypothetical protein